MGQHLVADLGRISGDHLEHRGWQTGLVEDVGQPERRQRHLFGGFEHHPVAGRDRGRDLVRDLVHRMVERRDRGNHAQQRIALGEHATLPAVRRDVAGEDLAIVLERRLRREAEDVPDPADLVARILLAEPRLCGDQVAQRVRLCNHERRCALEDLGALRPRQRGAMRPGEVESTAHVVDAGLRHGADQIAGPRVADLDHAASAAIVPACDPHGLS